MIAVTNTCDVRPTLYVWRQVSGATTTIAFRREVTAAR
jgi:hypothetical protein